MHSLLASKGYRKAGNSPQRGPEWHGPCPVCGGNDRFHIWPEQGQGSFWCRGCSKAGDLIEFYRWRDGLSYREACARAGVGPRRYSQQSPPSIPKANSTAPTFVPASAGQVDPVWAEHATKFAEHCHLQLLQSDRHLAWLAARGIDAGQVARFGLGLNPKDTYRPRPSWGLPMQHKNNGDARKLWLPMGLVIPQWIDDRVARLRIRRPDGKPKYYVVPGSGREPLITNREAIAHVVLESELDAILLDGLAGDLPVGFVAMGNASIKPTAACHALFARAVHLSISLDSDQPRINEVTGKTESPGAQGAIWWLHTYPQAARVPVIGGKDPGDAYRAGIDLRTWVLAGLPPRFRLRGQGKETAATVTKPTTEKNLAVDAEEQKPVAHRIVALADGREIHLTDNRQLWDDLQAQGLIVFSENELLHLQAACIAMDEAEKARFVGLVVDAKEVFTGAWVRRGEVVA
jgi:hypothetical protein